MISSWREGAGIPPDSFLQLCQMPTTASETARSATDQANRRSVIERAGGARREWNTTAGLLGCSLTSAIWEQCAQNGGGLSRATSRGPGRGLRVRACDTWSSICSGVRRDLRQRAQRQSGMRAGRHSEPVAVV